MNEPEFEKEFLGNPLVVENYALLQKIGVFGYIDQLNKDIRDYKNLLAGAVTVFQKTTIDEILDAAVRQISDHFLPSFIIFLWKPHQNKEDITVRYYENYQPVDKNTGLQSIAPFEMFFKQYPKPIDYGMFEFQIKDTIPAEDMAPLQALKPELLIPIIGPSGLYGIVMVGPKMLEREYFYHELFFLEQLMSFVSQSVQNHLHYEHSVRDAKTGLFNHGFFMTRLGEEIAHTRRSGGTSSLMVMDVDKFKNFNDNFGHLAGDRVLESIAFTIQQVVRAEDIPSRFGGEEFTILLPNTVHQQAWLAAERVRSAIESMKVDWRPPLPQVTISIGIVTFDGNDSAAPNEIIHRADEALYRSKEDGRNRVTAWSAEIFPEG